MSDQWAANIVAIDEAKIKLLSMPAALAIFMSALDVPVRREDLTRVSGRPRDEAERRAEELVAAGLLRFEGGAYVPTARHVREDELDAPGRAAFRGGMLGYIEGLVEDTRRAVTKDRDLARTGVGVVTLPDHPDVLVRMATILAQAEDELRALQQEFPPGDAARKLRVVTFVGSLPSRSP